MLLADSAPEVTDLALPTPSVTDEPTEPTPSATDTATATPTTEPSPEVSTSATPSPSATSTQAPGTPPATTPEPSDTESTAPPETESGSVIEVPTQTVSPTTEVTVTWQYPPAAESSTVTGLSVAVAVLALVVGVLVVVLMRRRRVREDAGRSDAAMTAVLDPTDPLTTADIAEDVGGYSDVTTGDSEATGSEATGSEQGDPDGVETEGVDPGGTDTEAAGRETESLVSMDDLPRAEAPVVMPPLVVPPREASVVLGARSRAVAVPGREAVPASELLKLLVPLGEALISSASPIEEVQLILEEVAAVNGHPETEVVAFPTALLVTVPGEEEQTAASRAGMAALRLDQVEQVLAVAQEARLGLVGPLEGRERLREIAKSPARHSDVVRGLGNVVQAVGLSMILGGGWLELLVAAALGGLVALVRHVTAQTGAKTEPLVVLGSSFAVAAAVFGLGRFGVDVAVLATLIPPLVVFLPGGLLTTAVIDPATGQMMAGAGRLAAGMMQTLLLGLGVLAAAESVGVVASLPTSAVSGLGVIAPWVGVALFVWGMALNQCLRQSALGWVFLVVASAYAGSVLGGLVFGGAMSAFVGAAIMTPVASYVATLRGGPPALVSFLPAFWILVPGSLAFVGITQALGDTANGLGTLLSAVAVMVSVSLGVLVGLTVTGFVARLRARGRVATNS